MSGTVPSFLSMRNLDKRFDGVHALDSLTFDVEQGCIVGVIGPNGAGKTTLFNVVSGFLAADSGTVAFRGRDLEGLQPNEVARLGVGRTFQDLRLIRRIKVIENVLLAFQDQPGEHVLHALLGWRSKAEERRNVENALALLEFVGLEDKALDPAEALSHGQQKLLTLACCLAADAELLLLDEPVAGVQPQTVRRILEALVDLKRRKKTILLIEHNLDVVREISDKLVVLDHGRKIAEGRPDVVMRDPAVLDAYLV